MINNKGMKKKSFSLYYNGGEIWAEHLDSINNLEDMRTKFDQDLIQMARPSTSTFIAINMDESVVNEDFLQYLLVSLSNCGKSFQKIVFVGLNRRLKRYIKNQTLLTTVIACMDDFEKAKEWLV